MEGPKMLEKIKNGFSWRFPKNAWKTL